MTDTPETRATVVGRAGTRRHVMRLDVLVAVNDETDVAVDPKGRGAR